MTSAFTAAVNALTALVRGVDLGPRLAEAVRLAKRVVALDEELSPDQKTIDTVALCSRQPSPPNQPPGLYI
jgi:hypothetical protein